MHTSDSFSADIEPICDIGRRVLMDQRDDMSYLKRYVQSHPDNRMAWYLLGKQYILEDKEGKANYCFLQAGSIYEAYERKKHPLAKRAPADH